MLTVVVGMGSKTIGYFSLNEFVKRLSVCIKYRDASARDSDVIRRSVCAVQHEFEHT